MICDDRKISQSFQSYLSVSECNITIPLFFSSNANGLLKRASTNILGISEDLKNNMTRFCRTKHCKAFLKPFSRRSYHGTTTNHIIPITGRNRVKWKSLEPINHSLKIVPWALVSLISESMKSFVWSYAFTHLQESVNLQLMGNEQSHCAGFKKEDGPP